ncbi:MAG: hypothetical protein HY788_09070 [Deltaproteobacteria bacterium]|nr:hypothetical protein [Deltaproteobacteria bacterium]
MSVKKSDEPKISMGSTKKEMIAAYDEVLKQLEEKEQTELRPEKVKEEKRKKEAVGTAEDVAAEDIGSKVSALKLGIGKMLTELSDKLETEVSNYQKVKEAVEVRSAELQEIYEIEKAASSLAALIEAQTKKQVDFETQMAERRATLEQEIASVRAAWDKEKKSHEQQTKEMLAAEARERKQEKEDYTYHFERDKKQALDTFQDEKAKREKELAEKIEIAEKDLTQREQAVSQKEQELGNLQKKVENFPKELEAAVAKATKQLEQQLTKDAAYKEGLLRSQFDGEKNVLTAKTQSLEQTAKDQADRIAQLSKQLETAYQKVQEIAEKAIEGSSNAKYMTELKQLLSKRNQSTESSV